MMERTARRAPSPRGTMDQESLARFFHGLSDPVRVRILTFLLDGPKTAGEIVRHLRRPQSSAATHVTCLRFCGYVAARRIGRNVVYEVIDPDVRRILEMGRSHLERNAERILACRVIATEVGARAGAQART